VRHVKSGGFTRREFAALAGGFAASVALSPACVAAGSLSAVSGEIKARPKPGTKTTASPGSQPLGLEKLRDAVLHLPAQIPATPMPLFVLLHGAGGAGDRVLNKFRDASDANGIAVLAPDSRGGTWDAIRGYFSEDVTFLDRALTKVFNLVSVDPSRVAIGGFSDGATYGLSLGLINGDLFPKIVACSPGFVIDGAARGKPHVFISHGTEDTILPIAACSRVIVPDLRKRGYDVTFREFKGEHEVPPAVAEEAMRWLSAN
jgi:predicted esterase